jgi:hypothetical protein
MSFDKILAHKKSSFYVPNNLKNLSHHTGFSAVVNYGKIRSVKPIAVAAELNFTT